MCFNHLCLLQCFFPPFFFFQKFRSALLAWKYRWFSHDIQWVRSCRTTDLEIAVETVNSKYSWFRITLKLQVLHPRWAVYTPLTREYMMHTWHLCHAWHKRHARHARHAWVSEQRTNKISNGRYNASDRAPNPLEPLQPRSVWGKAFF